MDIKRYGYFKTIKEVIVNLEHHVIRKISRVAFISLYSNIISNMDTMDNIVRDCGNISERVCVNFHEV